MAVNSAKSYTILHKHSSLKSLSNVHMFVIRHPTAMQQLICYLTALQLTCAAAYMYYQTVKWGRQLNKKKYTQT